jgi:hypothetical protein
LKIARLGNHHHGLPPQLSGVDHVSEHLPDELLGAPVGVVGARVDEGDTGHQGVLQGGGVFGDPGTDAIAPEPRLADVQAGPAKLRYGDPSVTIEPGASHLRSGMSPDHFTYRRLRSSRGDDRLQTDSLLL